MVTEDETIEKIKKLPIETQVGLFIITGLVMKIIKEYETEKASREIYNWLRHEKYSLKETIQIIKKLIEKVEYATKKIEENRQKVKEQ